MTDGVFFGNKSYRSSIKRGTRRTSRLNRNLDRDISLQFQSINRGKRRSDLGDNSPGSPGYLLERERERESEDTAYRGVRRDIPKTLTRDAVADGFAKGLPN